METDCIDIETALEVLRDGGLVGLPTETVYGLAGDATNPVAIRKVYDLKQRPHDHPLIVHCCDSEMAAAWVKEFGVLGARLARDWWPGPLTLVCRAASSVLPSVTGNQATVAVRVPSHPVALDLLRRFGKALVAPSANRFGRVSPTRAEHVRNEFPGLPVLDGGPCLVGIESTIVDCSVAGVVSILRPGSITAEQVFASTNLWPLPRSLNMPRSSGDHAAHYAPKAQVILLADQHWRNHLKGFTEDPKRTLLCLNQRPDQTLPEHVVVELLPASPEEFAARLYALFRRADAEKFDRIAFVPPPPSGIGIAIADRLKRAAHGSGIAETSGQP